jgi:hypothetical protein
MARRETRREEEGKEEMDGEGGVWTVQMSGVSGVAVILVGCRQ